jgi:hypothetical protein
VTRHHDGKKWKAAAPKPQPKPKPKWTMEAPRVPPQSSGGGGGGGNGGGAYPGTPGRAAMNRAGRFGIRADGQVGALLIPEKRHVARRAAGAEADLGKPVPRRPATRSLA